MSKLEPQKFDYDDPQNFGRPTFFNVDKYLSCVEEMITADEVGNALKMLEMLPGWYRDNIPVQAINIKKQLLKRFFTDLDYAKDGCTWASGAGGMSQQTAIENLKDGRGALAFKYAATFSEQGLRPHLFELAPGNYWLPVGLSAAGVQFTYFAPSLNASMQEEASKNLSNWQASPGMLTGKTMFICFEFLEHLADPGDIYHHYIKSGLDADVILLSTPKYTFGGGMGDWYNKDLGHLRTYTPNEFKEFAIKCWPTHNWSLHDGHVMCLAGEKK